LRLLSSGLRSRGFEFWLCGWVSETDLE
jgi:hypothetical protein